MLFNVNIGKYHDNYISFIFSIKFKFFFPKYIDYLYALLVFCMLTFTKIILHFLNVIGIQNYVKNKVFLESNLKMDLNGISFIAERKHISIPIS